MNCQEFQNQFEQRAELSKVAALHFENCEECRDHSKLLEMLLGLERVEVPGDFDFQLKARIAQGSPKKVSHGWIPSFQFMATLAPVALFIFVLAIGTLYFIKTPAIKDVVNDVAIPSDTTSVNEKPSLNETELAAKTPVVPEQLPQEAVDPKDVKSVETAKNQGADVKRKEPRELISKPTPDSGGGSMEFSLTPGVVTIPLTLDSNRKVEGSDVLPVATVSKLTEIWNFIGVSVNSLKIVSVGKNSVALRSGLEVGDIIEEIDGNKITADSIKDKQINVRSLTVVRDGKKLEIVLNN